MHVCSDLNAVTPGSYKRLHRKSQNVLWTFLSASDSCTAASLRGPSPWTPVLLPQGKSNQ